MKKLLFVLALCAPCVGWGQMLRDIDLSKKPEIKYMEVYVTKQPFGKSFFAKADVGQGLKVGEHGFQENQEDMTFKSPVEVLNWLAGYDWKLFSTWEDGEVRHYLMQRKDF